METSPQDHSQASALRPEGATAVPVAERVRFLKSADIFSQLNGEDLVAVAQCAQEVHFEAGETFIHQDEPGDCLYLLVDGEASIVVRGVGQIGTRSPKGAIGEMAIIWRRPRSADCIARSDLTALKIGFSDFWKLMEQRPALAQGVIKVLALRLDTAMENLHRLTDTQEEERRRIVRELHDGLAPTLAGMGIRLRTACKQLGKDPRAVQQELEEIAEQAQSNIEDIRRLIHDLRPAALDELGLTAALQEYVSRFQKEQGLEVSLSAPSEEKRLPAAVETALFRIVQEALANAARHARARGVHIRLSREQGRLVLCVSDDGQGFDPAAPRSATHVGLWSMQERAVHLGGEARIESAPGQGTRITVILPSAGLSPAQGQSSG